MQRRVARTVLSGIAAVVALMATSLIAPVAYAAEGPTFALEPACDGSSANVSVGISGLPPGTAISGSLVYEVLDPAGSYTVTVIPPGTSVTVGEDGSFGFLAIGPVTGYPVVWTGEVSYEGGTFTTTRTVDCGPPIVPGNDYAARVIVTNPPWAGLGHHRRRSFVVKVTNLDNGPFEATADDIAADVLVEGNPTGSVRFVSAKAVKPGKRVKFRYLWRYTGLNPGDDVQFSGCVNVADDPNPSNNCGSVTATAVAKP